MDLTDVLDHLKSGRLKLPSARPPRPAEPCIRPGRWTERDGTRAIRPFTERDVTHCAKGQALHLAIDDARDDDRALIG